MLIAQISDLHVKSAGRLAYGIVDTAAMLRACVADILALQIRPDVVIATGDLVDLGRDEEYELLRDILAPLPMQIFLVAGNHDDRDGMRRAFAGPGFEYLPRSTEFIQYAVDLDEVRLVVLDTVIPSDGSGRLCVERLDWVESTLSERRVPTIIAMHHPPFDTGIGHMDRLGLEGAAEFEAIIARHRHVERIVCGHVHRAVECRFADTVASICPSPAHQVALDLRSNGPDVFVMETPAYQLHFWHGRRLVSHTRLIGRFDGPHPFREDGKLID